MNFYNNVEFTGVRTMEEMRVAEKYAIKLAQTSKGLWYCEKVEVRTNTFKELTEDLEEATRITNARLRALNKNEQIVPDIATRG